MNKIVNKNVSDFLSKIQFYHGLLKLIVLLLLTHFGAMFPICTPLDNMGKPLGFLMFSWDMEIEN